ncbi:MAG: hypothetical protein ACLFVJ_16100 [Persicimonas sp.]
MMFIAQMIAFGVTFALIAREKKHMHGSPALMVIVMVVVGGLGYFGTMLALAEITEAASSQIVMIIVIFGWLGAGYGTYRFINHKREQAYYRRMEAPVESDL